MTTKPHGARLIVSSMLALGTSFPAVALGQTAQGFALSPFNPSERGSDWFAADSLDLRGSGRVAVGVVGDWSVRPLTFKRNGTEVGSPVRNQAFAHVGGAVVLGNMLRFGVNVPVGIVQNGDDTEFRPGTVLPGVKPSPLGDVRIGGDLRLFGSYAETITGAFGVQVFLPTGKRSSYTSDGVVRVVPRFSIAGKKGPFEYAAFTGVEIKQGQDDFDKRPSSTMLTLGASAGIRVADGRVLLGPELYGKTSTKELFQRESSPIEALLGAHAQLGSGFRAGLGVGTGITTAFGASKARVVGTLEWVAPVEKGPEDRDGDGVPDPFDACIDAAGVKHEDPKRHGCPEGDRDGDNILDRVDACPDTKGVASPDPKRHGCPAEMKDTDGDGIMDPVDACVTEKGVATDDPKTHGCPEKPKDTDGDGIMDPEDACPKDPGPKDPDPKKNGCPAVRVEGGQIRILQQVKFKTASSVILPESNTILEAVAAVLKEKTDIKKLRVEGHTDNKGSAAANKQLSKARASSVMNWLKKKGIDKSRLTSAGFGQEKPIDSNDTEAGRQNNRRVEFHIE